MKKNKNYKVLVLLDLKKSSKDTIDYTSKLISQIDADVECFCVKKPTEIIDTVSQLSAMREINSECLKTKRQLLELVKPLFKNVTNSVKTSYAIGHVKNEIEDKLKEFQPDIVVLGKRKQKLLNFLGDDITNFVSKYQKGAVLVASNKNAFEVIDKLSLDLKSNKQEVPESKLQVVNTIK